MRAGTRLLAALALAADVLLRASGPALADEGREQAAGTEGDTPTQEELIAEERPEETVGRYMYWDDGIHLTGRYLRYDLKLGGRLALDMGDIRAGEELRSGFPGLEGFHGGLRRLSVSLFGELFDLLEFKFEIDFADVKDIKDNWFRITRGPLLPALTFGHITEPFSMDELASSNYSLTMETALPTSAFAPGRNIGVTSNGSLREGRMTWAAGAYLNTDSFGSGGEAKDAIEKARGYNLTARVTGLPLYRDEGRELVHLGLSLSHRERDDAENDPSARFRSRPESRLTDDRLVDTGLFLNDRHELLGLEAGWKRGPFLLAGEYMHAWVDSRERVDFDGWYLTGGWVLTGESRTYNRTGGIYAEVRPARNFRPRDGGWGALELVFRVSGVDLNDGFVRGGEERNVTAGLNWYLRRKVRFMVSYVHARVRDRAEPRIEDDSADIVMGRFQVAF